MKKTKRRLPKPRNPVAKALFTPTFRPRVVKSAIVEHTRCKGYLRRSLRYADDLFSGYVLIFS